jgi:hypothetical protein
MDRAWQFVAAAPRAALVPVVIGVALAVLALLGPTVFLRDPEPFNRLMEFVELVLGRPRPSARTVRATSSAARDGARGRSADTTR